MKILSVNVLLDPVTGGGTAERTYQLGKALAQAGVECTILTTDIGLTNDRIKSLNPVKVVALPCIYKRFFLVRFSWSQLKVLVAGVDVIHLMGHWNMLNILIYLLARRTGTPYVVCPAGELPLFGRSRWLKRLFNVVFGFRIVRDAAGYVAVTPDELPAYKCYGVAAERVVVIPNGVNEADFCPSETTSFASRFGLAGMPFALFMGRLNPIKGPDLLLDAFAMVAEKFPEHHLVFAGPDGGLLDTLKRTAKERGIDRRAHFIGYIASRDKTEAYREAAFLVIPSRQEAMSIVVLEAGVVGTPVLLTDCCGFDEVASVGGGRVVHATVEALAAGLDDMLREASNLGAMGLALQNHVHENFTWEVIVKKYIEFFQSVVAATHKSVINAQ